MSPIFLGYNQDFLNEEIRSNHYVSRDMKKLWLFQLDMLNKFIQVCDKYNLLYWAEGGTLLGAVRHGGYIPWDDDIDIIMFRNDYEKFLKVVKKEFKYPYYIETERFTRIKRLDTTQIRSNRNKYRLLKNELPQTTTPLCISIDIFCMDNCPSNQEEITQFHKDICAVYDGYLKLKHKYIMKYHSPFNDDIKIKHGDCMITLNELKNLASDKLEEYQNICQKYNSKDTTFVFNSGLPRYKIENGHMRYKEDYDESVYLPFEMLTLRCPKGYDRILNMHYTDRNGIPWQTPVKNFAYHNQNADVFYDFDNPYTLYTSQFYDRDNGLVQFHNKDEYFYDTGEYFYDTDEYLIKKKETVY